MHTQTNKSQFWNAKQFVILALLFMMVGTALDLYLLDHYEGKLQLIPLVCITTSLVVMLLLLISPKKWLVIFFQLLMVLSALSGIYGIYLHLWANYEFELEMKPSMKGWELFTESLSGALPALAPASMIVLALIGYAYLLLLKQK